MKKGLVFLLLAVAVLQINAAPTSTDRDTPAELPVYWDLTKAIEESYEYEFGFYKNSTGTAFENDTLTLTSQKETTGVLTGKGAAYIKWEIAAPMAIELSLSGNGAMSGRSEEGLTNTPVNWKASWSPSNEVSISPENAASVTTGSIGSAEAGTASYQPVTIITHNGSTSQCISSGYCKIDIETANAFTAEAGTYSATLILGVKNN